jgi:acyl-CoA synthetase (AMP-forming)/AMP-acid ligase II
VNESEVQNVAAICRESAQRVPARLAFAANDEEITFADFWRRIARLSSGLESIGLTRGDRAIVMVPMSIDLYVILLSLFKNGTTAVFLDPWVGLRQLKALARFTGAKVYIGTPKSHLLRLSDSGLRSIPLSISPKRSLLARHSIAKLETSSATETIADTSADETALITFTTGSSGRPKGVIRTHGILTAQHRALAAEFPSLDSDVDLCTFPVFALNNLALGVTTVIPPVDLRRIAEADPHKVAAAMRTRGVTTVSASPPLIDALSTLNAKSGDVDSRHPQSSILNPQSLPRVRRILTGGAPVTDEQLRRWTSAFPETKIEVVYGSTEAEPVAHMSAEERLSLGGGQGYPIGKLASCVRGAVVRIERGPLDGSTAAKWQGLLVSEGEVGELVVSGDHVGRDYDRNPEAVRENKIVDPDGVVWHRMGDTGRFDADGRFRLVGRVHSTIVRKGRQLHAQVLERIARDDAASIRRVAAVGMPDPLLGQRAVIVAEGTGDRETIARRFHEAGVEIDEIVVTRTALPLDPRHNSKIDYARLRELLEEGKIR